MPPINIADKPFHAMIKFSNGTFGKPCVNIDWRQNQTNEYQYSCNNILIYSQKTKHKTLAAIPQIKQKTSTQQKKRKKNTGSEIQRPNRNWNSSFSVVETTGVSSSPFDVELPLSTARTLILQLAIQIKNWQD